MISVKTLEILLVVAGLLHLCITSAGLTMTLVLNWRRELTSLCDLSRQIVWTHGVFVLLTIIAFGVISIVSAPALASGQPLARAICGFIAGFWAVRILIGLFIFDARPHLTNGWLSLGYHGLTAVFAFFVICYGIGAIQ